MIDTQIGFVGQPLDRADHIRNDAVALEALKDERALLLRLDGLDPVMDDDNRIQWGSLDEADGAELVFLGLMEEITGRLADLLESAGTALDSVMRDVFLNGEMATDEFLHNALRQIGREGDLIGRVRLSLLTIERAIGFFGQSLEDRGESDALKPMVKAIQRDVQALEIHADFLSSRLGLATDTTLGVIGLAQNTTVKILSVVAALFLPPTLIASAYGMNFANMPEVHWRYGYPMALGLMVVSAVGTYLFLKWKKWL